MSLVYYLLNGSFFELRWRLLSTLGLNKVYATAGGPGKRKFMLTAGCVYCSLYLTPLLYTVELKLCH